MATMSYRALIRTHHITSRKKVAVLKAAAKELDCYALLRSGGVPGVMFVSSNNRDSVQQWVDIVHDLRYKDYQLVSAVTQSSTPTADLQLELGKLEEVSTVKEMSAIMGQRGLLDWWRNSMGFSKS